MPAAVTYACRITGGQTAAGEGAVKKSGRLLLLGHFSKHRTGTPRPPSVAILKQRT